MSNARPILFFSRHCSHCKHLLHDLQQAQVKNIHMVCVDNTPRERIPSFVKSVPTLVLGPNVQPLVGDRTFEWLEQQIHATRGSVAPQASMQQANSGGGGGGGGGGATTGAADGPAGWQCHEMGNSLSDSYSFLDDATSAIPKNFEFITGNGVDVTNPFPHMEKDADKANRTLAAREPIPSGGGALPGSPSFSMSPPASGPASDELSSRMERMREQRENEAPMAPTRIG